MMNLSFPFSFRLGDTTSRRKLRLILLLYLDPYPLKSRQFGIRANIMELHNLLFVNKKSNICEFGH